jgi:hypothetical protein
MLDEEPIVSEAIWDEVNRIVEEQRKAMVRPGKRPKHIFAGKLRCKCGRSMYVLSATPKYFCEQCRTRIPIVDLEAIFLDQLKSSDTNRGLMWPRPAVDSRAGNLHLNLHRTGDG